MKYPWIFEFLYTEIFVFGQMFGDFTEFSVEFSRRESWLHFVASCQCQPIYELSPIGSLLAIFVLARSPLHHPHQAV